MTYRAFLIGGKSDIAGGVVSDPGRRLKVEGCCALASVITFAR
jgi:hypothetical protein